MDNNWLLNEILEEIEEVRWRVDNTR